MLILIEEAGWWSMLTYNFVNITWNTGGTYPNVTKGA